MPHELMHGALGMVLLSASNETPEGTLESIKMLRVSLAYLESRYRHQVAERHRQYDIPPTRMAETKPNGEAKPKNKGGRPRKQAAAPPAPAQPVMFGDPPAESAPLPAAAQ